MEQMVTNERIQQLSAAIEQKVAMERLKKLSTIVDKKVTNERGHHPSDWMERNISNERFLRPSAAMVQKATFEQLDQLFSNSILLILQQLWEPRATTEGPALRSAGSQGHNGGPAAATGKSTHADHKDVIRHPCRTWSSAKLIAVLHSMQHAAAGAQALLSSKR